MERPTKAGFPEIGMDKVVKELIRFKNFMDEIKEDFFLIHGTCLGIIRDGALIEHDKDVDIGMMGEDGLYRILEKEETKYKYYDEAHVVGNEKAKILWLKKYFGEYVLPIEIVAHYIKDDYVYFNREMGSSWHCKETKLIWPKNFFNTFGKVRFMGIEFNIPNPVEGFLTIFYGNDWRTPKKYTDWRYNCANLSNGYWYE